MSVSVQYKSNAPGVIIEYIPSNSISITGGATAVPAIATPAGKIATGNYKKIQNWMEFDTFYDFTTPTDTFYYGVRSYFQNGGGPCYLVKDTAVETVLPQLDDVTLFVQGGQILTTGLSTLLGKLFIFAILDGDNGATVNPGLTDSPNAAIYYPWLNTQGSADVSPVLIAPSFAVAGVYCQTDSAYGPWWTPANISLRGVTPAVRVTDSGQAADLTINVIRDLSRRTAVVWGGRTQNDTDDWQYISVKRLFNMLERDIRDALRRVVFNPNTSSTWQAARSAITAYLYGIWQAGGLAGESEDRAFFVNIGRGITMTDKDIVDGIMIVEIGVAAVRPAEFIVLRFSQIME